MSLEEGERYRLKSNVSHDDSYAIVVSSIREHTWESNTGSPPVQIANHDLIFIEVGWLREPILSGQWHTLVQSLIFQLGDIQICVRMKEASNFEKIGDTTEIDHSGQIYNPFTNTWSWF